MTKMPLSSLIGLYGRITIRHDAMLREIEIKKMSRDKKSQMSEEWLKNKQ
jgi:predicted GIY-YIG superfamily endonuclease